MSAAGIQLRIPSKYLVEVKTFFSTTQYILLLQQNELKKFSMEKDNRQQVVEQYAWNTLLDVQVSPRSPTEFTIDLLHVHNLNMRSKERLQLLQSASNKANSTTQLVLQCAERDKLVAELKHIIHIKNNGSKPLTQLTCWYMREVTDNYPQGSENQQLQSNNTKLESAAAILVKQSKQGGTKQLCKTKIYPTAIVMLIDRQSGKQRGGREEAHRNQRRTAGGGGGEIFPSQNPMGSIMVSAINADNLDTQSVMMESTMRDDFHDESAGRSLVTPGGNYLQSRAFQFGTTTQNDFSAVDQDEMRAEHDLDKFNNQLEQAYGNDFIGFGDDREVDGNQVGDDGAIGIGIQGHGGNMNTAFGANYARNHNPKLKDRYSQHEIYLNELTLVVTKDLTISLVKENQEIEQIVFKDEVSFTEFLTEICNSYSDLMKKDICVARLRLGESLRGQIDFLNWPNCTHFQAPCTCTKTCFGVDIDYVCNQKVILQDYRVELDQKNIYLVSKTSGKPIKQKPLVQLQSLRVIDDNPVCNLMLKFENHVQINVKAATHHDRERLIASIITMRNLEMSDLKAIQSLDTLQMLHNRPLDHSHRIQAYSSTATSYDNFSQTLTTDYELSLLRKLSEHMQSKVQTMDLNNVIDEILLNATFCYITKVPESCLKIIMEDLRQCFQRYLEYEEHNPDLIEFFLAKSTLQIQQDARVNFLATLHADGNQHLNQQVDVRDESLLFKDERHTESEKEFQATLEQIIRYLNVLKCLLNSRVFFQEMSNQQSIFQSLTLLMISKSPIIALLSASVVKAACHHFSGKESKLEKVNKRVLIRGDKADTAAPARSYNTESKLHSQIQATYVKLKGKVYFFDAIFDYLRFFERLYDEHGVVKSQHLAGFNLVLSSILQERQHSTSTEDLAIFAKNVSHSSKVPDQEQSSNKPIFQLFDKFCLLDSDCFDIQYFFTMMLTQSLDHFFTQKDMSRLRDMQEYILTYSIQFIWHLYLLMISNISHQRTLSIKHLAMLLNSNQECHDMLQRILPWTLFHKVRARGLPIQSLQWDAPHWEEFFTKVVPCNFDSATEQWNSAMRAELTSKLLRAKKDFISVKQLNTKTCTSTEGRELLLPIHEFSSGKLVMSRWRNIKWNYKEFEVEYDCLASEYLVGNYFLARLLHLKPSMQGGESESDRPQLTMPVLDPAIFWNQLLMQFMASKDEKEQKIIVMTMCVLYRRYSRDISHMQTIPYWLKLIEHPEFASVHFLLLQLLHVALSVPGDLAKINMQLLIKAKGFLVLHNCMNLVFKELKSGECGLIPSSKEENSEMIGFEQQVEFFENEALIHAGELVTSEGGDRQESSFFDIDLNQVNFTDSNQLSRYFSQNTLNVNKGILALRIIDQVFKSMQFQYHLPMPTNAEYMLQKHALATLTQMLMLQNTHLTREVLHFVEQHLNNHYTLYKLKHSGLIEYLILSLNTRNGERALSLLMSIQEVCITFNEALDFTKFNCHDLEMIREDKDVVFGQEEQAWGETSGILNELEISMAAPKDPQAPLFDEVYAESKRQGKRLPPVLESIFLRYLPAPFIKFLFEQGQGEFLRVYRMDTYCHPILIWNRDLRQLLEERVIAKAQSFIADLTNFAADSDRCCQPSEIPVYTDSIQQVVNYETIEKEVRCGRYYLSVWTKQAKKNPQNFFWIPSHEEEEFHSKMKTELQKCIEVEGFADRAKIIILLKSCLLALKKFSVKRIQCLSEIKTILVHIAAGKAASVDQDKKMILFTGMRIVSMAINHDAVNREEVLAMDGVRTISDIISHILHVNKKAAQAYAGADENNYSPQLDGDVDEVPVKDSNSSIRSGSKGEIFNVSGVSDLAIDPECMIDRINAKTLNLCVDSITVLVNENIQAFMEFPLLQRVKIFQQMSQLLDLSFELYPLLEKRKLKPFSLTQPATPSEESKADESPSKQWQKRLSMMLPPHLQEKQSLAVMTIQQVMNSKASSLLNSGNDARMPQTPSQPTKMDIENAESGNMAKLRRGKSETYDYDSRSLISIIKESKKLSVDQKPDPYSICLIFNITSAIFRLTKSVSVYPMVHPELIASGLFWRTIQHCFFDLTEKIYRRSNILRTILKDCTYSLKLVVTFVDKFMKSKPEEQKKFGAIFSNKTILEILKNFHECIKKLFTAKILEKLFIQFQVTRDLKLETTQDASKEFLKIFSTQQLQSPELVWNDLTRAEMHTKLRSQILSMESDADLISSESAIVTTFCSEIKDFEYSVNKTELRIQGIFVKYFNEQCRQGVLGNFSRTKLARFANQIVQKLEEFSLEPQEHTKNIRELIEAFKNLMISLNLVISSESDFERYFATLCNFIELKSHSNETQESKDNLDDQQQLAANKDSGEEIIDESEKHRVFELSSHVLEIFRALINRRLKVPQLVYQQPQQAVTAMGGRQSSRLSNRLSYQPARSNTRSSQQLHQQNQTPVMINEEGKVLTVGQQAEQMGHLKHGNYLLKCQPFFRLLVKVMYQREIQAVPFKQDVIPMLQDMINIPEYVMVLFIDQGLIMFLLNLIFDSKQSSVISREIRGTLTDYVLKIDRVMQSIDRGNLLGFSDRQSYGVVKAFIPPNFFAEINEQMWRWRDHHKQELVQLQMRFLDNFDKDYFENALIKWDKGLRDQSMAKVHELCEKIIIDEPFQDLRQLHQISNMELEKEERIMEVILRNYNHNPAVFINTKLNGFITEVANQLFAVSQQIYTLRQDDVDGMLKAVKIDKLRENPEKMTNTQRRYKYLCYQAQLQLTTLLLSIEQLLYNEYNPNLLQTRQDEKLDAQSRLTAQLIQRTTDTRQVEERVFKYFNLWLQYPVFLDDEMSEHIRITFLQALFLIIDVPTSMAYLKKSEVPLEFISSMISRIVKEQGSEQRIVEDSLILLVCQKMLRVDLQYTCPQLAIKDTLDQLVKIAITKRPLQRYIKQILYLISQNTHYQTNVMEVLERNNGNRQDLDRLRSQSNADFVNQVWRAKPSSATHARTYYEWSDNHTIQRTLYAGQLDKLPIISPDSIKVIRYEFLPDDLRDFIESSFIDWQQQRLSASLTSRKSTNPAKQSSKNGNTTTEGLAALIEAVNTDVPAKSQDGSIIKEEGKELEKEETKQRDLNPLSKSSVLANSTTIAIEEEKSREYGTMSPPVESEAQQNDLSNDGAAEDEVAETPEEKTGQVEDEPTNDTY